jgi:hypothetical protein
MERPALPLAMSERSSRERWIRLCRAARGRPLGGRERQRPWGCHLKTFNASGLMMLVGVPLMKLTTLSNAAPK